jgi:hypothetical protein
VTLVMSKKVEVELGADLQEDFESFIAVCESFGIKPRINSFLYYVSNFGTYANPKEEEWE